jgi:chromosome partitioning protein
VWALADIASIIDEAKSVRDGLRCFAFLNFADPGKSADNVEAAEAVANYQQFEYLPAPLGRRKAFANAAGTGLCVYELKPQDIKATEELQALCGHVF